MHGGDELIELIKEIQKCLDRGAYHNEADVREAIVLPVLQNLKWNIINPDQISREFDLKGTRVDYALFVTGAQAPLVIIEVKAVGRAVDADQQLFKYAFHAGAPLAILTDGREWRFYYSYGTGNYSERLVRTLNITEMRSGEVAEYLRRYLDFQEVQSKRAIENAKKDLEDKAEKEPANKSIPKIWKQAVDEPDDQLIKFLINKTAQESGGISPDRKNVIKFLRGLTPQPESMHTPQKSKAPKIPARHDRPRTSPSSHQSGNRNPFSYKLFGETCYTRNFTEAYKDIHIHLAKQDSTFLKRLEPEYAGAKGKKYLTRNISDIRISSAEIIPGWHLDTNLSNSSKEHYLKIACRVAGIKFGKDLKIDS